MAQTDTEKADHHDAASESFMRLPLSRVAGAAQPDRASARRMSLTVGLVTLSDHGPPPSRHCDGHGDSDGDCTESEGLTVLGTVPGPGPLTVTVKVTVTVSVPAWVTRTQ